MTRDNSPQRDDRLLRSQDESMRCMDATSHTFQSIVSLEISKYISPSSRMTFVKFVSPHCRRLCGANKEVSDATNNSKVKKTAPSSTNLCQWWWLAKSSAERVTLMVKSPFPETYPLLQSVPAWPIQHLSLTHDATLQGHKDSIVLTAVSIINGMKRRFADDARAEVLFHENNTKKGEMTLGSALESIDATGIWLTGKSRALYPFAFALKGLHRLKSLNVSFNPLGELGMKAMTIPFSSLTALSSLSLSSCCLGFCTMSGGYLARCLQGVSSTLTSLDLSNNGFGSLDDGGRVVASAIQGLVHLERLLLHRNGIGKESALSLADSLAELVELRHIDLSFNKLEACGLSAISTSLLAMKSIQFVSVASNGIDGCHDVIIALFSRLPHNCSMDLRWNSVGSATIEMIRNHSTSDVRALY